MNKDDILKVATDAYFLNSDMVKFLLVENLALKTLLHEKGVITPEEFKEYKKRSADILEEKTRLQTQEYLKKLLNRS